MKRESLRFCISPYGRASSTLETLVQQGCLERRSIAPPASGVPKTGSEDLFHLWLAYSAEVDDDFVRLFRQRSTPQTRLLVMDDPSERRQSIDTLFARFLDLHIRSPQRLYVMDCYGAGKSCSMALLFQRLAAAFASKDSSERVLDARIERGLLRVVSPEFKRLDVPVAQIPALANADPANLADFEIDEDGSFIYWPKVDVHLGWEQLFQIINPEAARKAKQKHREFNIRYGKAVQKVREKAGLRPSEITGLSEKQLRRIESGDCRLTSNAAQALAKAHGLVPNAYLQKLAEALST